ncbi:MAG: NAD-binding protein, partial [Spirochaetes bacterium]|nr:NAD-binding protein [Spirochaetota bacterium]
MGSGGVGLAIANDLKTRNTGIILVDSDPAKVETLKEQNLNAMLGNIGDGTLLDQIVVNNLESVFIVSSDVNANKKALDYITKNAPDV